MPSESKLKAQMLAAIAAKKKKITPDSPSTIAEPELSEKDVVEKPKVTIKDVVKEPVKAGSFSTPPPSTDFLPKKKPVDNSVANEAEFVRTFFSRPVRVGVLKKQVYFCVPDVLETSNNPEKQFKYPELKEDAATRKVIDPLVITMWFANLGGGNEKLDAAKADDLLTIIKELNLTFPSPIDKWLADIDNRLTSVLG